MSISHLYPSISPSLSLNFARSKTLDPRITFSRTSTATRVNETGLIEAVPADAPRFDHKYENGVVKSLGLLVEEQRTNLVTDNSTDFNYSISNQIIATALDTAPDGNIVLCKHDLTGATSPFLNCRANTTLSSGNTYTMSMWLKGTTNFSASFAFVGETTSEIYSNTANVTTEWKRFTLTFTLTNTQTLSRLQVFFAQQGEGKVISIWGAQLELGSFATTYIPRPTAGQQATRTKDVAYIDGSNFTEWFNINEGTLFVKAESFASAPELTGVAALNVPSNFSSNRIDIRYYQGGVSVNWFNSEAALNRPSGFSLPNPRFITGYKQNTQKFATNGSLVSASTSFTPSPNITHLQIGTFDNFSYELNGCISQLTYYPTLLTDTQLINLTK